MHNKHIQKIYRDRRTGDGEGFLCFDFLFLSRKLLTEWCSVRRECLHARLEVSTAVTEEFCLLEYKNPVRTSQETLYVATTELSQLMLCKIWDFHGGDYEECLLGYKNPVPTSQKTYYISATEPSRLIICQIWGFHGGDYEECRLLECGVVWFLWEANFRGNVSPPSSGWKESESCVQLLVNANVVARSLILPTLMLEAIRSSNTPVLITATQCYIPEDGIPHSHRRENLKS
jgi:hypothetical protein